MIKQFRFIDLFAGIGGIRIAFESQGGRCVFTSEWDKFSQKTYSANFIDFPRGDLTQISELDIPNHDVLLAGFPCQPFSQAGLKRGFDDIRGTLFFDIVRILKAKKPKMVLLENVKGFASHDKGNTFKVVCKNLEKLGYEVHSQVLNAKDFGVPQNRERIYIVGIDRTRTLKAPFDFPTPPKSPISVGKILEKRVDEKYTISNKLWAGHKRRLKEHREKGNGFGYSLFNSDSPYTSTISARYYKDGSEILIEQAGKNPRKITPREAARLQGFPDSFVIPVSDAQAYRQFGNSVAVPVVTAIAVQMVKLIK
jgi:DNA (cytosine-5)-methyltransferase 1